LLHIKNAISHTSYVAKIFIIDALQAGRSQTAGFDSDARGIFVHPTFSAGD